MSKNSTEESAASPQNSLSDRPSQEKINQSLSRVCSAQLDVMTSICTAPPINLHMHQNQSVRDQTESCNLEFNIPLLAGRRFHGLCSFRQSPWNCSKTEPLKMRFDWKPDVSVLPCPDRQNKRLYKNYSKEVRFNRLY